MMLLSWQIFHWVTTLKVLVYVEKINDGGVVFSKGDVVALDDGDEVVGVEVVVSEFDSSDTESNESGSESGFDNDNEGVVRSGSFFACADADDGGGADGVDLLFFLEPPPTGTFLREPPSVQYLLHVLQKYLGWERL